MNLRLRGTLLAIGALKSFEFVIASLKFVTELIDYLVAIGEWLITCAL